MFIGRAVIAKSPEEDWEADVVLFANVVRASAARVLVVTCDAHCFPAFQSVSDAYNRTARRLREILESENVGWWAGRELHGLATYDGYHFRQDVSEQLLDAVQSWFQRATEITARGIQNVDLAALLKSAVAPKMSAGKQAEYWWEFRSGVSGGTYEPWCKACGKYSRGGHEGGKSHEDCLLRLYGMNPLPGPPQYTLMLPTGTPKQVSASTTLEILAAPAGSTIVLKSIPEAGLRCLLGKGLMDVSDCGREDEIIISINGMHAETPGITVSAHYCCVWVQKLRIPQTPSYWARTSNELPMLPLLDNLVDRVDAYFGLIHVGIENLPYVWHCSRWVRDEVIARQRGHNQQLVGLSAYGAQTSRTMLSYPNTLALERDQASHNMCLVDTETKHALDAELRINADQSRTIVGYGVGGQYDSGLRGFKYGLQVYALEIDNVSRMVSFVRRQLLVRGNHPGCLELRHKFKGVGEFDGQPCMIHFRGKWLLYTRANCHAKGGCRQVQVCGGENLDRLGEFTYASFAGVPLEADIYFVHVYCTAHGTLAAIFPMAEKAVPGSPTKGGIYIAESDDGIDFGCPVLLMRSTVFSRRTFDVPLNYPSLVLRKGQAFDVPLHVDVKARMPDGVAGMESFKWYSFQWPERSFAF